MDPLTSTTTNEDDSSTKPEGGGGRSMIESKTYDGLSMVSRRYDIGKKGFLTDEEKQARSMDVDGEGKVSAASAVKLIEQNSVLQAEVKTLKKRQLVMYFVVLASAACAAVAAVVGADRAQQVQVASGGLLSSKADGGVVKTAEAIAPSDILNMYDLSKEELAALKYVSSGEVDSSHFHLAVKGYVRNDSAVVLFVEGGSLAFDRNGYTGATGDHGSMIDVAFKDAAAQGKRALSGNADSGITGDFRWAFEVGSIVPGGLYSPLPGSSGDARHRHLAELSSHQAVEDLVEDIDEDVDLDGIHYRKDGLLSRSECEGLIVHFNNNSESAHGIPPVQSLQVDEISLTLSEIAGVIGAEALRSVLAFLSDSLGEAPVTSISVRRTYADGVHRMGVMGWHMHERLPGFREGTVIVALNPDDDVEGGALYVLTRDGPVEAPRSQGRGYAIPYNTVHSVGPYKGARYSLLVHTNHSEASVVNEI